ESVYPAAFTEGADLAASSGAAVYLLQQGFQRVIASKAVGSPFQTVFQGVVFDHLAATPSYAAAAAGDLLYLSSTLSNSLQGQVVVAEDDAIVGLAAFGDTFLVSTTARQIFRVRPKKLPITRPDEVEIVNVLNNAPEPIRKLVSDGE